MWKYKRRLSIVPQAMSISFAGERLDLDSNGCVLSPVSEELASKMRNAPHVFTFDSALTPSIKEEKVVSSPKKRTRSRKKKED